MQRQQPHVRSTSHALGLLRPLLAASPWNVHVMPAPPPPAAAEVVANVHQTALSSIQHQSGQTNSRQQLPQRSHYFHGNQPRPSGGSRKHFGQNRYSNDAKANHLSPVKKRVKENTPPQKENLSFSSKPVPRDRLRSRTNSDGMPVIASELTTTLDNSSPAVNCTALSCGSEEEFDSANKQLRHNGKARTGSATTRGLEIKPASSKGKKTFTRPSSETGLCPARRIRPALLPVSSASLETDHQNLHVSSVRTSQNSSLVSWQCISSNRPEDAAAAAADLRADLFESRIKAGAPSNRHLTSGSQELGTTQPTAVGRTLPSAGSTCQCVGSAVKESSDASGPESLVLCDGSVACHQGRLSGRHGSKRCLPALCLNSEWPDVSSALMTETAAEKQRECFPKSSNAREKEAGVDSLGGAVAAAAASTYSPLLLITSQYPHAFVPPPAAAARASGSHHSPLHFACLPNHPSLPSVNSAAFCASFLCPVSYPTPIHPLSTSLPSQALLIQSPCCGIYATYVCPTNPQRFHYLYQT